MSDPDCYEFDCSDCKIHVFAVGLSADVTPAPIRCAVCQWILDYIPEHERDEVRARLHRDR